MPPPSPAQAPVSPSSRYTVEEYAQAVRQLYPGHFDSAQDSELVQAITELHPMVKEQVEPPEAHALRMAPMPKLPGYPELPPPPTPSQVGPPRRKEYIGGEGSPVEVPAFGESPLDYPAVGVVEMGAALHQVPKIQSMRQAAGTASKFLRGGMKAASPLLAAGAVTAPLATAAGVALGTAGAEATTAAGTALGVPQEYTNLASDVAGLAAGGYGAHGVGKLRNMAELAGRTGASTELPMPSEATQSPPLSQGSQEPPLIDQLTQQLETSLKRPSTALLRARSTKGDLQLTPEPPPPPLQEELPLPLRAKGRRPPTLGPPEQRLGEAPSIAQAGAEPTDLPGQPRLADIPEPPWGTPIPEMTKVLEPSAARPEVPLSMEPATRLELRRMVHEFENFERVPRSAQEVPGQGSTLEWQAGTGGAPVYHDILAPLETAPTAKSRGGRQVQATRTEVRTALEKALAEQPLTTVEQRIVDSAKELAPLRANWRQNGVSEPLLPPEAGQEPTRLELSTVPSHRRFFSELGALILDVPQGDPIGLKRWFQSNRKEYGQDRWFTQAEEALKQGDSARAWQIASVAAHHTQLATAASSDATDSAQKRMYAGFAGRTERVPFQMSQATEGRVIQGGSRVTAGPPIPPEFRGRGVTQAETGVLQPPPIEKAMPARVADRFFSQDLLDDILPRVLWEQVVRTPGTSDITQRVSGQITEQILTGKIPTDDLQEATGLDAAGIAQYVQQTYSALGRGLGKLGGWTTANAEDIKVFEGLAGGVDTPADRTLDALANGNRGSDRGMALYGIWTRQAVKAPLPEHAGEGLVSPLRGFVNATIPFLVSLPKTAIRNLFTQVPRYAVGAIDQAISSGLAKMAGQSTEALEHWALAVQLAKSSIAPGKFPRHPAAENLQGIFDWVGDSWKELGPSNVKRSLRLLTDAPEDTYLAAFLGRTSGGEDTQMRTGNRAIDALLNPKFQNKLTALNRWQEFTARSTAFDAHIRGFARAAGHDPDTLLARPTPEVISQLGPELFDRIMLKSTAAALDWTFASKAYPGSVPDTILRTFGDHPLLKTGYPFPRFNLVAAPRFLYDYSMVSVVDNLTRGLPMWLGVAAGELPEAVKAKLPTALFQAKPRTRLQLGLTGQKIEQVYLPEIDHKLGIARDDLAKHATALKEATQEARRLSKAAQPDAPPLPGVDDPAGAYQEALQRGEEAATRLKDTQQAIRLLGVQRSQLSRHYGDILSIGAPTLPQFLSRELIGTVGFLSSAMFIRSQPGADGTEWYQYRVPNQPDLLPKGAQEGFQVSPDGKDLLMDLRAYAPFTQYLLVADVMEDYRKHTNWPAVRQAVGAEGAAGSVNPYRWFDAISANYTGKYTSGKLSKEFAQAFLSISRAAGTTLTFTDFVTNAMEGQGNFFDQAWEVGVGTIGQMLARFTVPAQFGAEVAGQFSSEEAKARIPSIPTRAQPFGPFAAPLQNIPGARQLIPETLSQTSGDPIHTVAPLVRALAGLTVTERDFIQQEITRTGLSGSQVYVPSTGDTGLDQTIAKKYSALLKEILPEVLREPFYQQLDSPALKRDFLGPIFGDLRRAAVAEARDELGVEATGKILEEKRPGKARQQERWRAAFDKLDEQLGPATQTEGEPGSVAPPPPPPR